MKKLLTSLFLFSAFIGCASPTPVQTQTFTAAQIAAIINTANWPQGQIKNNIIFSLMQGLSISGSTLTISGNNYVVLPTAVGDKTVTITSTDGCLVVSGTYPNFTLTNTCPDVTVTATSLSDNLSITGTYPNFTFSVTSASSSGGLTGVLTPSFMPVAIGTNSLTDSYFQINSLGTQTTKSFSIGSNSALANILLRNQVSNYSVSPGFIFTGINNVISTATVQTSSGIAGMAINITNNSTGNIASTSTNGLQVTSTDNSSGVVTTTSTRAGQFTINSINSHTYTTNNFEALLLSIQTGTLGKIADVHGIRLASGSGSIVPDIYRGLLINNATFPTAKTIGFQMDKQTNAGQVIGFIFGNTLCFNGIGTFSPTVALDVVGSISATGTVTAANIASGTYTPVLTNVTNVTASTSYQAQYMKIGNVVTVSGKFDLNPTLAASTATELGISLPIASNFSAEENLGGDASSDAIASEIARIKADATNDRASVVMKSISISNDSYAFTFTYLIQ